MNIQVPWAMREQSGLQSSPYDANFWLRSKFRDQLDVAKPSQIHTRKQDESLHNGEH